MTMKPPTNFPYGTSGEENRSSREELVRRYFDGELSAGEEREALLLIAEDPLLRDCLRHERELPGVLRELRTAHEEVPEGFSDRVMAAVMDREAKLKSEPETRSELDEVREANESAILERLTRVLERMMEPARFELRPVWAMVALLALLGGWLWSVQSPEGGYGEADGGGAVAVQQTPGTPGVQADAPLATRVVAEEAGSVWIRFVFIDPDAEQLAVAGDFTGWEPLELTREQVGDRQVWTGMVQVPRGEHHYMFIRNGEEWVTDPFAEITRDDGFGNENAVLYL